MNQNIVAFQGNLQDLSQKRLDESNLLLEIAGSHVFEAFKLIVITRVTENSVYTIELICYISQKVLDYGEIYAGN